MELSPLARNLISRATALVIGLLLIRGGWYFVHGIVETEREQQAWLETHPADATRPDRPAGTLALFAAVLGLPGLAFVFFAIMPTQVLYALPLVSAPRDPRDDAEAIEQAFRRWNHL